MWGAFRRLSNGKIPWPDHVSFSVVFPKRASYPAAMLEPLRMQSVQSPIIPVVAELIRQCPGTISLGQGVVSYDPPPQAIDKIQRFLADPENHKYKPVVGLPQLLEAFQKKLETENRSEER